MKKILKLTTIAFLFAFSFSCEKDDSELDIESTVEIEKTIESNLKSRIFKPPTICDIIGDTIVTVGTTASYSYINDSGTPNNVTWSITTIPINSATVDSNGTVTFSSRFISGTLLAFGSGGTALTCEARMNISTGIVPPPPSCACPNPVIDDRLCVSGGHPHWRFQVDGISSSDQITWSINHGTIHSNPNQSYVIIEPNSGSTYGFTVYCKVERTCPDGSKKVRTAYYTNYYGNSCGTGTTGFIGSCSGSGEILDDPIF
jgi:hypothetical protein